MSKWEDLNSEFFVIPITISICSNFTLKMSLFIYVKNKEPRREDRALLVRIFVLSIFYKLYWGQTGWSGVSSNASGNQEWQKTGMNSPETTTDRFLGYQFRNNWYTCVYTCIRVCMDMCMCTSLKFAPSTHLSAYTRYIFDICYSLSISVQDIFL